MNVILDDKLIKTSNDIYLRYVNDGEIKGFIKTCYDVSPTNHEYLLLKRDLKSRLLKFDTNYYIDDIEFEFTPLKI